MLATRTLFFGNALWVFTALIFFIAKVEHISQRAAVEFCESQAQEDVYLLNYGYKSYVPWFYGQVEAHQNPEAYSSKWLLKGPIDKDLMIITKINKVDQLQKEVPDADLLYAKNGFYFYKRAHQSK